MTKIRALILAIGTVLPLLFSTAAFAGPPWTEQEFFDRVEFRTQIPDRTRLLEWWAKQPPALKSRILAAEQRMWWPIILCNYFGYKIGGPESYSADKCEAQMRSDHDRGIGEWTQNGQYMGPTDACRARNKRDQYGRLDCG